MIASSPTFYFDADPALNSRYVAYTITNPGTMAIRDLQVTIGDFTGGVVSQALHEDGVVRLGTVAPGASITAFFYLQASGATALAQGHTLNVYSGPPAFSAPLSTQTFSIPGVVSTLEAAANKVTSVVTTENPAALGSLMTIVVTGDTGTIGNDKIVTFTPAGRAEWRADAFELLATSITLSGPNAGTFNNTLVIAPELLASKSDTHYVAIYTFRAVAVTTTPTPVCPTTYITSGSPVKHTATDDFDTFPPVLPALNTVSLALAVDQPELPGTGGEVTYTLTLTNTGATAVSLNELDLALASAPNLVTDLSGTATYGGAAIDEPYVTGQNLAFTGNFSVPAGGTATLVFHATVPATLGTFTTTATGLIGSTLIDTTTATTDSAPAAAPVKTASPFTLNEDTSIAITGISLADVDALSGNLEVTLSVASGTLTTTAGNGVTVSGSGTIVLSGTLADLNAFLSATAPLFAPVPDSNGAVTLTMTTSDNGFTGEGGTLTDTDTSTITVNPVNDAPINTLPASYSTDEDSSWALTGLSAADIDAASGTITVTLAVASGTIAATSGGGVTVAGSGTGSVTLTGTLADINALLSNSAPTYAPVLNFNGPVSFTMTSSDLGNTGAGGTLTFNRTGDYSYVLDDTNPAVQALVNGQTLTESFAYTLTDVPTSDSPLSDTAALTFTIVGTNDAPIIDLNSTGSEADALRNFSVTYTEDAAPVSVAAPIADALHLGENDITKLTFVAAGQTDGASEKVTIAGTVFPLNVNGGTVVTVGGTSFVLSYTAATGTFAIEKAGGAPFPQADLDALLRGIAYQHTSQNPTDGDRTLTFTALDAQGLTSSPAVSTINVDPISDVDVDDGLLPAAVVISEVPAVSPAGTSLSGDMKTLTVPGQGIWTVQPTGTITFTPETDYFGSPTPISYTITDVGGLVSNAATVSVTVTPVNDPPIVDLNSDGSTADTHRNLASVFTEGDAPLAIAPAADLSDLNEIDVRQLRIVVAGIADGAFERITVGGVTFNPTVSQSTLVFAGPGSTAFQITYIALPAGTGGTFVITEAGASVFDHADVDALLRAITYENTDQDPVAGDRTLTITARDVTNRTSAAAVATITVVPVNDPPIALDDTFANTPEDNSITIIPKTNDSDVDSDPLFVSHINDTPIVPGDAAVVVANGLVSLSADGSQLIFTPNANYYGPVSFEYTLDDHDGGTDTAVISGTITSVNDAPVATDDGFVGVEDLSVVTTILTNDSDADGNALTVTQVEKQKVIPGGPSVAVTNGTVALSADGTQLIFTPTPNFNGPAAYAYTITDGNGGSATATVSGSFDPIDDAPIAVNDTFTATEDSPTTVTVLTNDSDADFDPLTITEINGTPIVAGGPAIPVDHGTVALSPDGTTLLFTPEPGFTGPATFTDAFTDPSGASGTATVSGSVGNVNDQPAAIADINATTAGLTITGNVLTNDFDFDGNPLTVSAVNGVSSAVGTPIDGSNGGVFTINPDGTYSFEPGPEFTALAAGETQTTLITYTISDGAGGTSTTQLAVTITGLNDAPISTPIAAQSGSDDEPTTLDVSSNFADSDASDQLSFSAFGLPPGLSIDPITGVITGVIDPYSVTITVTDLSGAISSQTFDWSVTNPGPSANNDVATTTANAPVTSCVLTNDTDPDNDVLTVAAINGSAANLATPVAGSNGGSFTISADGSYSFDPGTSVTDLAPGQTSTSSVTYTLTDSKGGTSTATVTVTVSGTNEAPTSTPIDPQADIDSNAVTFDVGTQFSDPDGASDALTFSATGLPTGLSIDPLTGVITGTIDSSASASGPYSVTITATDSSGATAQQTFEFTVTNPTPTANPDPDTATATATATVAANSALTGLSVLSNDTDSDSDPLAVSAVNGDFQQVGSPVSGSDGGTFTINADGTYDFTPGSDFNDLAPGQTATTSIAYTVTDHEGGTSTATVTITVTGANDVPTSTPIADSENLDSNAVTPDVSSHFADTDGAADPLTFTATGHPLGLSIDPQTGVITGVIDSSASVAGPYEVTITATDESGLPVSETFTFNVTNLGPAAYSDEATTDALTLSTGNVLTNDPDPDADADPLSVVAINGSPANVGTPVVGDHGGRFTIDVVSVSDADTTAEPGGSIVFTVTYDNPSARDATGVTLVQTLPANTTFDAAHSAAGWVNNGDGTVTLSLGTVPAGTTGSVLFAVLVSDSIPAGIEHTSTTSTLADDGTHGPDLTPTNNTDAEQTSLEAAPDVVVTITGPSTPVTTDSTVPYSVTYVNTGNQDGTGIVLTISLPPNTSFNPAVSTPGWIDQGGGIFTLPLGSVPAGGVGQVIFAVDIPTTLPSGIDDITTSLTSTDDGTNSPTPDSGAASVTTRIVAAPIYSVTIDDKLESVFAGDPIKYEVTVTNTGNQDGSGVTVTNHYPAEVLLNVTVSHGGIVDPVAGTITWQIGDLPVGATVKFEVEAKVSNSSAIVNVTNFSHITTVTDSGLDGAIPATASDNNVLKTFAFDSINNASTPKFFGFIPQAVPPLMTRLMPLPIDPIFSGMTEPGATLVGKIYDRDGNLIGERQVMSDSSGNWIMSFPGSVVMENPYRMDIQQTAAIQSLGSDADFNFRRFYYPASLSSTFFTSELTVNSVMRRSAYEMVDSLHDSNEHPYGFAWYSQAYELLGNSLGQG